MKKLIMAEVGALVVVAAASPIIYRLPSVPHSNSSLTNTGLQCHTAPFSWKLVFECDHYLYEITMTACSPKEELEWRSRIIDRSFNGNFHPAEQFLFTSISLPIKAMGQVFGKLGRLIHSKPKSWLISSRNYC